MAAKCLLEKPPPAYSSSSDDDDDSSSSSSSDTETVKFRGREEERNRNDVPRGEENVSGSDGDDEVENVKTPAKKPKPKMEEESESDSEDTNTTPSSAGFTIKPVASKPADEAKRKESEKDSEKRKKKRRKVSASNGGEDPKSTGAVQRLWSEDDEIAILKGMSDYQAQRGSDPYADMADFHSFIRESLSVEASKAQLTDKIRRLKKKYLNNAEKAGDDDEAPVFSRPHELKSFELSKKIWGVAGRNAKDNAKSNKKSSKSKKAPGNAVEKGELFWAQFPGLSESLRLLGSEELARTVREAMPLIGSSQAEELEEKWKKLQTEEIELYVQRCELARETCKVVLDSIKSSNR